MTAAPGGAPARRPLRVVTLGGGHGLFAMLSALLLLDPDHPATVATDPTAPAPAVTAVVTVADDGGSSGRLRREMPDILPPGDLRMALAALAAPGPTGTLWQQAFQHRFAGDGALAGHPVGNLVLAGLAQVTGDPVAALDAAGAVMGARGRVLPMSCRPLTIVGAVSGLDEDDPERLRTIRGQVAVAATPGQVRAVRVEPADAPACPEAVAAVLAADVVVLGPGSWFTSVLPHLLVPGLREALVATEAARVVVLNLVPQPGETAGFSPEQHLDVVSRHAPDLQVDAVVVDDDAVLGSGRLLDAARALGGEVWSGRLRAGGVRDRHDPASLAHVVEKVVSDRVTRRRGGGHPAGRPSGREERAAWR